MVVAQLFLFLVVFSISVTTADVSGVAVGNSSTETEAKVENSTAVLKNSNECMCGENEDCKYNEEVQTCFCRDGYANKSGMCSQCRCGDYEYCWFNEGIKNCICPGGYVDNSGKCIQSVDPWQIIAYICFLIPPGLLISGVTFVVSKLCRTNFRCHKTLQGQYFSPSNSS